MPSVAAVIPSARSIPESLSAALWAQGIDSLLVVQDHERVEHRSDYELLTLEMQRESGLSRDVIGNGSAACRNFGLWYAIKEGYDIILSFDDDVMPAVENLVSSYRQYLTDGGNMRHALPWSSHWISTIYPRFPRGFPYEERWQFEQQMSSQLVKAHPVLHMGTWREDIDYNAADKVVYSSADVPEAAFTESFVTEGSFLDICGMNFGVQRDWAPFIYQVPAMNFGDDSLQLGRMDDIIGGVFFCALAEIMHAQIGFGHPAVIHKKRDVDILRHAHLENLGNVFIGKLSKKLQAAARSGSGRFTDLFEGARHLVQTLRYESCDSELEAEMYERIADCYDEWFAACESLYATA